MRARLLEGLEGMADQLERRSWVVLVLFLLGAYLPLSIQHARNVPLTHDEIFTVHIAQAPNLRTMLALRREIDLHPPLHYLLERVTLRLPAPRWFDARLPNILAGLLALAGVFAFAKRRLGPLTAFTAVIVFWFGPLPEFAWQNRPYMLWYALLALLMVAWSRATSRERSPMALVLVAALALLLAQTHLFGLACLLPFAIAEAVRARRTGRWDWQLLLALAAPLPLAALALFQIQHLGTNTFPADRLPSIPHAVRMYFHTVTDLFYVFGSCALVWGLLPKNAAASGPGTRTRLPLSFARRRVSGLLPEDYALLIGLTALPLLLMAADSYTKIQFWDRYGYFVAIPEAVLIARLLQHFFRPQLRHFAVLTVLALFIGAAIRFHVEGAMTPALDATMAQQGVLPFDLARLDPSLPIVTANPMTYIEMSDRESAPVQARTVYLTDYDAAMRFSGYTLFDNEEKIRRLLQLTSRTAPLDPFLATTPRFYMVGTFTNEQEWLPRALAARHIPLQYLGKFLTTYEDSDLYFVDTRARTAPEAETGRIPYPVLH